MPKPLKAMLIISNLLCDLLSRYGEHAGLGCLVRTSIILLRQLQKGRRCQADRCSKYQTGTPRWLPPKPPSVSSIMKSLGRDGDATLQGRSKSRCLAEAETACDKGRPHYPFKMALSSVSWLSVLHGWRVLRSIAETEMTFGTSSRRKSTLRKSVTSVSEPHIQAQLRERIQKII